MVTWRHRPELTGLDRCPDNFRVEPNRRPVRAEAPMVGPQVSREGLHPTTSGRRGSGSGRTPGRATPTTSRGRFGRSSLGYPSGRWLRRLDFRSATAAASSSGRQCHTRCGGSGSLPLADKREVSATREDLMTPAPRFDDDPSRGWPVERLCGRVTCPGAAVMSR